MKLNAQQLERVAEMFRAFSDATRLSILQELKSDELSVSEIVARLSTTQANISKQLKQLHLSGLLERRKQGTQVFYQIADPMVLDLCKIVCEKLNRDSELASQLKF